MAKEVFPSIFQVRVPLPRNPLGHLNSYLVRSGEQNLLIDTGMNSPQAFKLLLRGLSEVGLRLEELTGILLTHFHVDHVGLIPRFKETSDSIQLLIHRVEAEFSRLMASGFKDYMKIMETFLKVNGAPPSIAEDIRRFHPAFFSPKAYEELAAKAIPLEDGQVISVGEYDFKVLWTPGHSPGHICLYEPSLKVLFSGDHLLPTITPHVAQFLEDTDPLSDYLKSLKKTEKLDVEVVLPAHEKLFSSHRERIGQLRDHHEQRLTEILHGLKAGSSTAYMLASKVHWDVNYKSWDKFPPFQKYLAVGETLAHLNLLEQKQLVKRNKVDQTIFYCTDKKAST